jgi:hypothetical protein
MKYPIYNIPVGMELKEEWKQVVFRSLNPEELVNTYEKYKDKLVIEGLEFSSPEVFDESRFNIESSKITQFESIPKELLIEIYINEKEISKLYLWRILLQCLNTVIVIEADNNLFTHVKKLTQMGYRVLISSKSFKGKDILKIIDYYFHTPQLRVPIEPIHGLFRTWVSGKGLDMPEFYRENPEKYFYVNDDGKLTLSYRYAEANFFYENMQKINQKSNLFKYMSECSICNGFRICGGAAKREYPIGDCDFMNAISALFAQKVADISEDIKELIS